MSLGIEAGESRATTIELSPVPREPESTEKQEEEASLIQESASADALMNRPATTISMQTNLVAIWTQWESVEGCVRKMWMKMGYAMSSTIV